MLSDSAYRWGLVLHAILAGGAVAAATHWVVWLWPFRRGSYPRLRGAKRFGVIAMALYGLAFALGLLLYPTSKAKVKLEYLTSPDRVAEDAAARVLAREELRARAEGRPARTLEPGRIEQLTADAPLRAEKVARWFDVKEHWVALGLVLGLATMAVLLAWDPRTDGRGPVVFVLLGASATALILWAAAIIGLVTTATRAV